MSRPLNGVATSSLLLVMSRLLNDVTTFFLVTDVATAFDLATDARPLNVVATLISLQADVATATDSVLMLQPLPDVVTSMFCQL